MDFALSRGMAQLHQRLVQAWVQQNPAYLLSALTMLLGCYLLLEPGGSRALSIGEVWLCLGVVQLYEAGLLAGIWLSVRKGGPVGEARLLTGILGLFLGDCLFLGHALAAPGGLQAIAGALLLVGLVGVKLALLRRILLEQLPAMTCAFVGLSVAIFLAVPLLLTPLKHGGLLTEQTLSLAAWLIALPWVLLSLRRQRNLSASILETVVCLLGPLQVVAAAVVFSLPVTVQLLVPFLLVFAWAVLGEQADRAESVSLACLLIGLWFGAGLAPSIFALAIIGRAIVQGRRPGWMIVGAALVGWRLYRAGWTPQTSRGWGLTAVVAAFVLLLLGLLTTALREQLTVGEMELPEHDPDHGESSKICT